MVCVEQPHAGVLSGHFSSMLNSGSRWMNPTKCASCCHYHIFSEYRLFLQ
jgi:hypothetical protein